MSGNKLSEDKFDQMLTRALQQHSEPVPADFSRGISEQIRRADEQAILARVAMKERLALAGCIALGVISLVIAVSFPSAAATFTQQVQVFIDKISQINYAAIAVGWGWQYYVVFAGIFGFAVYNFTDLLVGNS